MQWRTMPVFLVFLTMGFVDVVGPMVGLAKETFHLSHFSAQLLPFSGLLMFGVLSIPVAILQDRVGKKPVLILGLCVALVGLVFPMMTGMYGPRPQVLPGDLTKFYVLLGSIFLLGSGLAILQVVGNPLIRDVSPPGGYSRNLSFAQAIKAVGASVGFLLPPAVQSIGLDWPLLFPVFSFLLAVTLILNLPLSVATAKSPSVKPATFTSCLTLLAGNRLILMMVLGIAFTVGAEFCFHSSVPLLLKEKYDYKIEIYGLWLSWSLWLLPFLIGRLSGAVLLRSMTPQRLLSVSILLAGMGLIGVLSGIQVLALAGIVLIGLGLANIWPLIFSLTVDTLPQRSNEISGLMISAALGGALLQPVMGFVVDITSVQWGFLVPGVSIIYLAVVAKFFRNRARLQTAGDKMSSLRCHE